MTERVDLFQTIGMIMKAFRDDSVSEAQIKVWYQRVRDGRDPLESDRRSGRPATSRTPENVKHVQAAINENRRSTVPELVSEILTEYLGMNRVAAKFVPRLLSQERKKFRAEVAQDFLEISDNYPHFLKQVITANKSWVYGYDPETKA